MAAFQRPKRSVPDDRGRSEDDFRGPGAGTSRIGTELREARERLGYEVEWVANALRIKPAFIHAIERGDLQDLPGTAYAVGFVRTYAIALGLDANEAIRRFKAEREEVTHKTDLVFPAPAPQRGVPAGALVLVGAVIVIAGYIGWYHYSGRSERMASSIDSLPAHLEPLAPPPAPKFALVKPAPVRPKPVVTPDPGPPLPNDADVSPSSAAAAVPMPAPPPAARLSTPPTALGALAEATPPPAAPDGSAALSASAGQLVIEASGDAWIEIKNGTGRVIYQHVLHSGESYTVPDQPELTLTTGNATVTTIALGGTPLGPLKGHVVRNLPLDAASLKTKLGPAAAAPDVTPAKPDANPSVTNSAGHTNG
ncbi:MULTISPECIES: RodZ domain-containing protein [unclassified Acidisoma]|uniref:helix-turn-helix domain-containing protein n=1 Tax=unclassified Acidisoma TaxID=2634065 RepID=UPI00131E0F46|nr:MULTISPECIES: RodZ domain-containing protein [unclassified Acidisoma]